MYEAANYELWVYLSNIDLEFAYWWHCGIPSDLTTVSSHFAIIRGGEWCATRVRRIIHTPNILKVFVYILHITTCMYIDYHERLLDSPCQPQTYYDVLFTDLWCIFITDTHKVGPLSFIAKMFNWLHDVTCKFIFSPNEDFEVK